MKVRLPITAKAVTALVSVHIIGAAANAATLLSDIFKPTAFDGTVKSIVMAGAGVGRI